MSLAWQKYLAVTGLTIVVGGIVGWFFGPFAAPAVEPDVFYTDFELKVGGTTAFSCGEIALAQSMLGCIIGAAFGLVIGPAVAWWLPTPAVSPRAKNEGV